MIDTICDVSLIPQFYCAYVFNLAKPEFIKTNLISTYFYTKIYPVHHVVNWSLRTISGLVQCQKWCSCFYQTAVQREPRQNSGFTNRCTLQPRCLVMSSGLKLKERACDHTVYNFWNELLYIEMSWHHLGLWRGSLLNILMSSQTGRWPWGRPRSCWGAFISHLACERLGILASGAQEELPFLACCCCTL